MNSSPPEHPGDAALRILHLEDNPYDSELIGAMLQSQLACAIEIVATAPDFMAALEHSQHDVILSDSSLPGFDGLSALALAKQVSPATPFVFCTGSFTPEWKSKVRDLGALDSILKDDLDKLISLLRRLARREPGRPD